MKKSLELLSVKASGLDIDERGDRLRKSDDEIFNEACNIVNLSEKESYLKENLKSKPFSYVKSKRCLAELLKSKEPQEACDLVLSACKASPIDPKNYLLFAEIALENNALKVASSALEVVTWLCIDENDKEVINKNNQLLKTINEKIANNQIDNSKSLLWHTKSVDKYWILEKFHLQSKYKELINYSFRLLELFPNDIENYNIVSKVLLFSEHKEGLRKFIDVVNHNLSNNKKLQNLYLGASYYGLLEFDNAISALNELLKIEPLNPRALFYLALCFLSKKNIKEFVIANQRILPSSEPAFTALYFICNAVSGLPFAKKEFPNQKNISYEISLMLNKLSMLGHKDMVYEIISQFKKLEYFFVLPYLPYYLSELFITHNQLDYANSLLDGCTDSEVHRLKSWIYRLQGKEELGESELSLYRMNYVSNKDAGIACKLISLILPSEVSNDIDQIFLILEDAFKQTKELIRKIELEYGLNSMTCIETGCQDCCKKTFPYVSYTEYLYMKKWLEQQSEEYQKQIRESSMQIVNSYKERYKKDPPFMVGKDFDQFKEYPLDFMFSCPYLGDNKCNVYEHRPFTCRAYGYSSQDGTRYKGCNYFFEQLKSATKLSKLRKVIDISSFTDFTTISDGVLIGKRIIAPIPIWFAQSHEETMKKVQKAINL